MNPATTAALLTAAGAAYLYLKNQNRPHLPGTTTPPTSPSKARLIAATVREARARGIRPSFLLALADHESGLDPLTGVTKLQNATNSNTAWGPWQMIRASFDFVHEGYGTHDPDTNARAAAKLYASNKSAVGHGDHYAIAAWWVGAGGARKVLDTSSSVNGGVHGDIDKPRLLAYVADVERKAQKYQKHDS